MGFGNGDDVFFVNFSSPAKANVLKRSFGPAKERVLQRDREAPHSPEKNGDYLKRVGARETWTWSDATLSLRPTGQSAPSLFFATFASAQVNRKIDPKPRMSTRFLELITK